MIREGLIKLLHCSPVDPARNLKCPESAMKSNVNLPDRYKADNISHIGLIKPKNTFTIIIHIHDNDNNMNNNYNSNTGS